MADAGHPLLPELARSLRSLGRPSDAATDAAHAIVFVPLLAARARAGQGDMSDAIAALRGAALAARIESLARTAVIAGRPDPAHARAGTAAVREVLEPLHHALTQLDALAVDAGRSDVRSPAWEAWLDQLRRVFGAADVACRELAPLLAEPPVEMLPRSRWFGRRGGGAP